MPPPPHHITKLLRAWTDGDEEALRALTPVIYGELHRIAQRCLAGERGGHTLQTTELVNEAYLRLVDVGSVKWQNRAHFFALSARLMRRILVDLARARLAKKRGAGVRPVALQEAPPATPDRDLDFVALDAGLANLAQLDARKAQVVELRFFGGLSVEETAEVLKVSPETVMRDWKFAKVWLFRELATQPDC